MYQVLNRARFHNLRTKKSDFQQLTKNKDNTVFSIQIKMFSLYNSRPIQYSFYFIRTV